MLSAYSIVLSLRSNGPVHQVISLQAPVHQVLAKLVDFVMRCDAVCWPPCKNSWISLLSRSLGPQKYRSADHSNEVLRQAGYLCLFLVSSKQSCLHFWQGPRPT